MSVKSTPKPCRIKVVPYNNCVPLNPMPNFSLLQKLPVILVFCSLSWAQQVPVGPPPNPQSTLKPSVPKDSGGKDDKKPDGATPGAAVDSNTYKIGPADVLNVKVWNEEKFSGLVVVHQDGKITIPLIGEVQAGDTTPRDVETALSQALTKYVVKPLVTVTVQEVQSKRYYLDGMVNRPGEYQLVVPTTILEAISRAGGLQDFANKKKIYILRSDKKLPFNYKDVINGKNMDQNIRLEPGDHIYVP
jgi:polysaccharide export outer membrane protein